MKAAARAIFARAAADLRLVPPATNSINPTKRATAGAPLRVCVEFDALSVTFGATFPTGNAHTRREGVSPPASVYILYHICFQKTVSHSVNFLPSPVGKGDRDSGG